MTGGIPYHEPRRAHDSIEHFQCGRLGVIDETTTTTTMPPRSDVFVERTGELAFQFGEDAACLVLEMGAVIHAGQDAIQQVVYLRRPNLDFCIRQEVCQ